MSKIAINSVRNSGALKLDKGVALFVCDIQEKFRRSIHGFDAVTNVSKRLIDTSKILKLPTVITEMYPKGLGKTVPELGNIDSIPVFAKEKFTMLTPEVINWLESNGPAVNQVILCGIEAHVCILSTALNLIDMGKQVHCIVDGCSSRSMVDRKFAFKRMEQSGVFLTTSESAILSLLCGSDHPDFKQIQKIIMPTTPDSGLL